MKSCSDENLTKFHDYHGDNIVLLNNNTVAHRKCGFADAITFSEKPLCPNEIFMVEIEEDERGWIGCIRMGLTQLDPNTFFKLPKTQLPDVSGNMGKSWIMSIPLVNDCFSNFIRMYSGINQEPTHILPTDVGSRIGVTYVPDGDTAAMHFIINGKDLGPATSKVIPHTLAPIYAVVDVYGTTKQVKIVQLHGVPTLQSVCRRAILQKIKQAAVSKLPLPNSLKYYLLYQT